jgi:hypothetical protein
MAPFGSIHLQTSPLKGLDDFLSLDAGKAGSYGDALDPHQFEFGLVTVLDAELDHFPDALHQRVQALGLRVTTAQFRDARDVPAIFVTLDDNRKLPLGSHLALLIGLIA